MSVEEVPVEEVPAEEAPALDGAGGSCGAGLTWELTDDGVFTISGSGSVDNYNYFGGGEKHAPSSLYSAGDNKQ